MKLINSIKKDFNTLTWVLIPVAIMLNIAMSALGTWSNKSVFLYSLGTILVSVICGPWAGLLTGALHVIVWSLLLVPTVLPWFLTAGVIGLVAGLCANAGLFKSWWKALISAGPIALVTVIFSAFVGAYLAKTTQGMFKMDTIFAFVFDLLDKSCTTLLAFALLQAVSPRFLARFPRPENAKVENGRSRTQQMLIALGAAILLYVLS